MGCLVATSNNGMSHIGMLMNPMSIELATNTNLIHRLNKSRLDAGRIKNQKESSLVIMFSNTNRI